MKHKAEEIVSKLRQIDILVAQGNKVPDAVRSIGVSQITYYRWRREFEWVAGRLIARIDCAAEAAGSPVESLSASFMSHVEFVVEHAGVTPMMFGELHRAEPKPAKKVAHALMKRYAARIVCKLESAKSAGDIADDIDTQPTAILFIGTIQGLVMQAMLAGSLEAARGNAPGVLRIFLRGIGARSVTRPVRSASDGPVVVRNRSRREKS